MPADPKPRAKGRSSYDKAVEVVLNSGTMLPHMDDFWACVDGEITLDELRERIP